MTPRDTHGMTHGMTHGIGDSKYCRLPDSEPVRRVDGLGPFQTGVEAIAPANYEPVRR